MEEAPSKPRYIAYVAASIDGRISLTENTLPDWTSSEDGAFFQEALTHIDAVVVGHNTYEAAKARLEKRTTFVFSHRVVTTKQQGTVTFVNPDHADIAVLLAGYRTVGVLGGGGVYRFMLEHGLLDELYLTIEPLIFGRGKEMFIGGTKTTALKLESIKQLNSKGTLLLHYNVAGLI